jgi:putative CocE/NonD family hydrolase
MHRRLKLFLMMLVGLFLAVPVLPQSSVTLAQPGAQQQKDVDVQWGVKIPMRDGVLLNATVYRPHQQNGPLPVIFVLTPYIASPGHDRGMYFARNGYVFFLVDVRGRGNSEGKFEPFTEGPDGYDIVEWLARQSWSDGKVAMWGTSYEGFDQWSTASQLPPHLVTIVPAAAGHAGISMPMFNNTFDSYWIQWVMTTTGVMSNQGLDEDRSFWSGKYRELYLKHLPFQELDSLAGNPSPIIQKWLEHPTPDSYYDGMVPNAEQYKRIQIPILSITGDYDRAQSGALTHYRRHMKYGTAEAIGKHYLVIGPWDHGGNTAPLAAFEGLTFGPASLLDMNKLHKEWYDWTMKGGPKPEFLKKRVAYYVAGAEQWKYADSLEDISETTTTLYLHSDGSAIDVFRSGSIGQQGPAEEPVDKYVYDPLDVRPEQLERGEVSRNSWMFQSLSATDQSRALNLFGNGVIYHSAPFVEDTEVTGFLKFTVWMAIDVPDTDFQVFLYDILPDGTSIVLTSDQMRARYRESLTQEKLIRPGEINRYDFQSFTFFSRRITKGSRLRLLLLSPNSIYKEKNYNSGGVVARESGEDARTAHVTVYHDSEHPSKLELPIAK